MLQHLAIVDQCRGKHTHPGEVNETAQTVFVCSEELRMFPKEQPIGNQWPVRVLQFMGQAFYRCVGAFNRLRKNDKILDAFGS